MAAGSEIAFTTKQMGVPVDGKFGKFTAQIALDPKKPETGSVAFAIDTGSARFGTAELDAEYRERFGHRPRYRNPTWLRKRIAYKMQEDRFGGLPSVARARGWMSSRQ